MAVETNEEPTLPSTPGRSRLPAGTIPGLLILGVLVVLLVAMLRAATAGTDDVSGSVAGQDETAAQQPDYSHAERREQDDPFALGPVDAPVGLVIFSDYQCPFCARWSQDTLPEMEERAEAGELRIEHRDVNVYGPASKRAALASYAAAEQGHFWEFHDALYEGGRTRSEHDLSEEALLTLAGTLGMDRDRFASDLASPDAAEEIARNEDLGIEHGATATPVFILGGTPMVGAQSTDVFTDAFDSALDSALEAIEE